MLEKQDSVFCYLIYFNCSLSGTKVIVGKVGGCFYLSSGPLCVQMKNCSVAAERWILFLSPCFHWRFCLPLKSDSIFCKIGGFISGSGITQPVVRHWIIAWEDTVLVLEEVQNVTSFSLFSKHPKMSRFLEKARFTPVVNYKHLVCMCWISSWSISELFRFPIENDFVVFLILDKCHVHHLKCPSSAYFSMNILSLSTYKGP